MTLTHIKVVYSGQEYDIHPAQLAVVPTTSEDLKRAVERYLELLPGTLQDYTALEVEGRWVIAPAPVYG